jgi:hypothetical protein
MIKRAGKKTTELLLESKNRSVLIEEYDDFDWFQLMNLDLDDPSYEDDKDVMRLD